MQHPKSITAALQLIEAELILTRPNGEEPLNLYAARIDRVAGNDGMVKVSQWPLDRQIGILREILDDAAFSGAVRSALDGGFSLTTGWAYRRLYRWMLQVHELRWFTEEFIPGRPMPQILRRCIALLIREFETIARGGDELAQRILQKTLGTNVLSVIFMHYFYYHRRHACQGREAPRKPLHLG